MMKSVISVLIISWMSSVMIVVSRLFDDVMIVVDAQQVRSQHYPVIQSTPFIPLSNGNEDSVPSSSSTMISPGEGKSSSSSATTSTIPVLPNGFQIGYGPIGFSLVWTPPDASNTRITMGNARPEFRLSSSVIFGYPREINHQYHMPLLQKQVEQLVMDGMNLEVWKSGRRLDNPPHAQPPNLVKSTTKMNLFQTSSTTNGGGYDSKPSKTPQININPTARGGYTTRRVSYNLPPINLTSYPVPVEVLAEVYQPRRVNTKSPLVLFLHGRHSTCYKGGPTGESDMNWPCLTGYKAIPSYQGYRYVGDMLASQGYVAVSISANGINGQDYLPLDSGSSARSKLIRHHLKLISKWNTVGGDPWNNTLLGKIDMDRVVLVGHSRGGEGVHRAAIDATTTDPYKIVGIVTYGPTAFGRQVTPDVHSATILPTCDGDVSDLQGQFYVDRSRDIAYSEALRTAVTVLGANHNYFNTEWTPGLSKAPSEDDWSYGWNPDDPICGNNGTLRLTAKEQQIVGATYTAAMIKLAVFQDRTMLPLLDGSFIRPSSIGRAEVALSAVGGAANRLLFLPGQGAVRFQKGMKGLVCGYYDSCFSGIDYVSSPHLQYSIGSPVFGYELSWLSSIGATARFNVRSGTGNLTGYDWIDLRIANDPNKPPVRFDVVISDSSGRNATLPLNLTTIDGWPGTEYLDRIQAHTLRGRLTQSRQLRGIVDMARIKYVSLVARTMSGRVWLLDIATSKRQIAKPTVLNLPIVSVDSIVVKEGNGGTATVKVKITPTPTKPGEIWLMRHDTYESMQINITAGASTMLRTFPVSWTGNNVYESDYYKVFEIEAMKGVVTGEYVGGLIVVDDDPKPILSAVANEVTTVEGNLLRWTMKLSSLASSSYYDFIIVPPTSGTELDSDDIDQRWLEQRTYPPPSEPQPLSSLFIYHSISFDYGELTRDITIPIAIDSKAESNETMTLEYNRDMCSWYSGCNPLQPSLVLIGTVLAHN